MTWDYWHEPIDGVFRIREPIGSDNRRIIGYALREDDARLIAAAPDMLAALHEVEGFLDNQADADDGRPNDAMRHLTEVRAAIAKTITKGTTP